MMSSGSMASFRAAAPPEMFGEPDGYEPRNVQPKCGLCGAFFSLRARSAERHEHYYGEIVEVTAWPCKRCGGTAFSVVDTVGQVYGPLPPWSDPYMVWNEARDTWEHYMEEDYREMERSQSWVLCGGCEKVLDGVPVGDAGITGDGLLMIRAAGWAWNGISWECAACAGSFLEEGARVAPGGGL